MAGMKSQLTYSVQEKKERLYAVIQYKLDGRRETKWRALGLPAGAQKSKITKASREVVNRFEAELAGEIERRKRPPADIPVFEYMVSWLNAAKQNLQLNTYNSYHIMVYGRIKRYFELKSITVGSLTPQEIDRFYATIYADGAVGNTVIHYHAVLRKAFQQAYKNELIDANPFDRIERPKKNKFHGENYSEEEWLTLLKLSRGDDIYPAIMLAGCLGLRRSEALGVRWSRVDWERKTVLLDTKIVEYTEDHKKIALPVEEMKNQSSRRTLPLPPMLIEMLAEEKAKQELYRKIFKGSYNRKFDDYVCVNQLGELMMPSYVTDHFGDLLKKLGLRKIRFHDLRHTFASILINNDVPLINVSNFLGHSDISTTANIYAHLDKASKVESANIIAGIFENGIATK